jgi:hypothetical protein
MTAGNEQRRADGEGRMTERASESESGSVSSVTVPVPTPWRAGVRAAYRWRGAGATREAQGEPAVPRLALSPLTRPRLGESGPWACPRTKLELRALRAGCSPASQPPPRDTTPACRTPVDSPLTRCALLALGRTPSRCPHHLLGRRKCASVPQQAHWLQRTRQRMRPHRLHQQSSPQLRF